VMTDQTAAVDPARLGESVGVLSALELRKVESALRVILAL
jgi:mRNA interferase MazF